MCEHLLFNVYTESWEEEKTQPSGNHAPLSYSGLDDRSEMSLMAFIDSSDINFDV